MLDVVKAEITKLWFQQDGAIYLLMHPQCFGVYGVTTSSDLNLLENTKDTALPSMVHTFCSHSSTTPIYASCGLNKMVLHAFQPMQRSM